MREILAEILREGADIGLKINIEKTEIMRIGNWKLAGSIQIGPY